MTRKLPTIAIVGRTNVGKSTLFNALAGKRLSIVEDEPGVTRDRAYTLVERFDFPFTLIDTGGIIGEEDSPFTDIVRAQAELAIDEADLVLVLFDGLVGLHPKDDEVVDLLRRSKKPVVWCVNKCEKQLTINASAEFYALGIEDFICISASKGIGILELVKKMNRLLRPILDTKEDCPPEGDQKENPIKIAVVGRPNVGKSTFVNQLLGKERLVTSPVAGTTRDSIDVHFQYEGKDYVIVDTAGLRRKAKVEDATIERYANLRALKALSDCDVAILVLDAQDGVPSDHDKKIANLAHERGRALVIAMNKWDLIEKDHKTAKEFEDNVKNAFKYTAYAPIIFVSAKTGKRCSSVLKKASTVFRLANERIPTPQVTRIFQEAFRRTPPPVVKGSAPKLYYATQAGVAPPTFVLFVSKPRRIPDSYVRYLRSFLRDEFPFEGSDVKIMLRKKPSKKEGD
ncbi:MAG: ribosome biogenesis GTPase Der [SAR324 cluster bacterium]|uniref:GTPase Der n=1 Tax=SAR324 cluster bacterium TaxID=2024889 RepID=A0A7X9IKD6_9DELT|nr:ribosome biogenesis GTPase Der [SAR324 cluster bacterium]